MADISFYKYLEAAFRFRLRDPRGQRATPSTRFPYLGYNLPFGTSGAEKGIFYYARKVLPFVYTNEFPDTEEGNLQMAKTVLDRLDKEEKPLEAYVDKTQVTQEVYNLIADEAKQQSEQVEAGQAGAAPPPGEPAGTMGSGSSGPGFSSLGGSAGVSTAPRRVIHVVQPTGGKEGGTGTGTAATRKASNLAVQAPKIPYAFSNFAKNLSSRAGIFLKRNILPIARTGLGAFAGGVLTGLNPLGMLAGGVGGATWNAWGMKALNGTINVGVGISNQVSRGSLLRGAPKKRFLLLFLGLFFFLALGTAFLGAGTPGGTTGGGGTGGTGGGGGLDYTIPFKDSSVRPLDIRDQVRARWPNAQLQNWDTIVQQSIAAGWNPAFVLALWIEESGAQGVPNYTDALGCDVNQPTTDINISLACLFRTGSTFSNSQFADFMCRYSEGLGKPAPCQFITNKDFPKGVKDWYSKLVPSGSGALVPATTTPTTSNVSSCPLAGKRVISCGSFMSDPKYNTNLCSGLLPLDRGHCGLSYGCYDSSNRKITDPTAISNLRRAHSIDVNGNVGDPVYLPTINGQAVNWSFASDKSYSVTDSEGGGYGNVFRATVSGDLWVLHLLHTAQTLILPPAGRSYQSGDQVTTIAQTSFPHVHINIGKNPSGDNGGTGWLNPEDLGMCTQ